MLMKDKKKNSVALIMAKLKPSEPVEKPLTPEGGEDDKSIGLETAAEEIIMAMEQKSPKAMVDALKNFMQMCEEKEEYQEEQTEQE